MIFLLDTPNSNVIILIKALLLPHGNLLLIHYSYVCCMCICMYVCIYVYVDMGMYIYMCMCVLVCLCMCMFVHICKPECMYQCVLWMCVHVYILII